MDLRFWGLIFDGGEYRKFLFMLVVCFHRLYNLGISKRLICVTGYRRRDYHNRRRDDHRLKDRSDHHRSRGRSRDRSRDKSRDRSRDRSPDRSPDKCRERSSDQSRERRDRRNEEEWRKSSHMYLGGPERKPTVPGTVSSCCL